MTAPLLDREDLGWGASVVLPGVSFALAPGDRVALLGRSGVGKSTLLSAVWRRLAARGEAVALVPQDHALVPQLSVFHNVYMGRLDRHGALYNALNLLRPLVRERAAAAPALAAVGLDEVERRPVESLSGGQKQRVALARALHRGGATLVADEPVSAVDEAQARALLAEIDRAFPTAVLALHDVYLALGWASRVVGLSDGRIAFDAPVGAVARRDVEALYGP